jgi:hypothetical protein
MESQYLSYLARYPLSEVICGTHVLKYGDPDPKKQKSYSLSSPALRTHMLLTLKPYHKMQGFQIKTVSCKLLQEQI